MPAKGRESPTCSHAQRTGDATLAKSNRTAKPLTIAAIKAHKFGTIADGQPNRGLRLRANKSGSKTWLYRYRTFDNQLREIKFGTYPPMELSEARGALSKQKELRDAHQDPRETRQSQREEAKAQTERARQAAYTLDGLRCNLYRYADYPYLSAHLRRTVAHPGAASTIRIDHIKRHYYDRIGELNPTIVPVGPLVEFDRSRAGTGCQCKSPSSSTTAS